MRRNKIVENKIKIVYLLFVLFFCNFINAQNDLTIDDHSFVSERNLTSIEKSLDNGVRAFVLDLEESKKTYVLKNYSPKKHLSHLLDTLSNFLKENDDAIVSLLLQGEFKQEGIKDYLNNYFLNQVLFYNKEHSQKLNYLKKQGIKILVVFESDVATTSIAQLRNEKKYLKRFSSDPLDKLILFNATTEKDSTLLAHIFELWELTGKPPNFIIAPKNPIPRLQSISDSLNKTRRFRGIVTYNGTKLNEIFWRNAPEVITPARFSFPLTQLRQVRAPYKNGYRITPAEVIHHKGQTDAPRIFTAFDVILKDNLVYDFSFDHKIINHMEPNWDRVISKDISLINDPERGSVLHLNTMDSFIDYSKQNTLDFETPISISVWVKPDRVREFMGIIGFGMAFSLKLKQGNPDFTMATIKDHIIKHPLESKKWHHLVTIYNPKNSIEFYLDGKKIGESNTADIITSDQSLVIGNNIWGEQFYGSIDDLKIWDRGISSKEITELYHANPIKKQKTAYILTGVLLVLALVVGFLYRRRKGAAPHTSKPQSILKKETNQNPERNTLTLFGNFNMRLVSDDSTISFSPLHKQLLSFLILAHMDEKEGINTNRLTETFWPGVSKIKAKENRNGNIRKLRIALSKVEGLEVVFENKKWSVLNTKNLDIDIFNYEKLKENITGNLKEGKLVIADLEDFLEVLKKGNILQNTQTEWADFYKNKISNEVENLLSQIYNTQNKKLHPELNLKIAKTILLFDNLNEYALEILITELVASGKHGLAQNYYTTFSKNYETLYAHSFDRTYQSFIKKQQ
ncbi:hypothetical protein MWU65_03030 [Cellulophaga sp. F20128]|uniref:LamG-like jellyroll fold domain-containing protein n=1 Tax=Cellulophaga sp. F20128 TaxID=2926413 RepID=UPI001FF5AA7B|nr:LamG-like jellyroll fold domain-containing protein [Cellulophaga sp. F20128]MCK0156135.1 hypothetical protein [Cellulophaga sp. F20128]